MNADHPDAAACEYCGLPLPGASRASREEAGGKPGYCCFGCRFAAAVAAEKGETGQIRWTLTRLGLAIFFTMNVMVFTLALWTQDVFEPGAGEAERLAPLLNDLFRYICLIMAAPVLLLLGGPLVENTWANLRQRRVTTDVLLLLGVVAAFAYSAVSVVRGAGHVYFEVGCMVLVAVTLGRWLEAAGKLKTTEALESLGKLLPAEVTVQREGQWSQVPLESLEVGDTMRVRASQRMAADGRVVRNQALVDEQVLTGESEPVAKETGDRVLGGSLNLDGDLWIRVTARPAEGTLDRLVQAVREAAHRQGRYQKLADRMAAWFLPAVVSVAVATLLFHTWASGFHAGLLASLAVVLIACPCALGLATPMAVWAGLGRAAKEQVLFQDGDALTRLPSIRAVVLDKTGTLTAPDPQLVAVNVDMGTNRDTVMYHAAALASTSLHTLSQAICTGRTDQGNTPVAQVRTLPGRGVVATIGKDETTWLGSPRLMEESRLTISDQMAAVIGSAQASGHSLVCVGWAGRVHGVLAFSEQLRKGAVAAVRWFRRSGYQVVIMTGDSDARAALLGRELNVAWQADLLPEEKQMAVESLKQSTGMVAMVGDGVNDAPALAAADVGVAMGCGTDVARQTADICLLGNDLTRLPWAIVLAARTVRTIRQNLFWAFAYNTVGIGLAAAGWLNPIVAAVAMLASSFFVVSNSLRLAAFQAPEEPGTLPADDGR